MARTGSDIKDGKLGDLTNIPDAQAVNGSIKALKVVVDYSHKYYTAKNENEEDLIATTTETILLSASDVASLSRATIDELMALLESKL